MFGTVFVVQKLTYICIVLCGLQLCVHGQDVSVDGPWIYGILRTIVGAMT